MSAANCNPALAPDRVFVRFSGLRLRAWRSTGCCTERSEFRSQRTGDKSESEPWVWLKFFVRGGERSESESWRAVFDDDWTLALGGDRSESEPRCCLARLPAFDSDKTARSTRLPALTGERSESESWWRLDWSTDLFGERSELAVALCREWLPDRTGERSELVSESCRWLDRSFVLCGETSESESCLCWGLWRGTSRSESESWRRRCRSSAALWRSLTELCAWPALRFTTSLLSANKQTVISIHTPCSYDANLSNYLLKHLRHENTEFEKTRIY